ncbi:MAG: hypothetical protein HUU15_12420 [Candidatus Brocadiae bacterium]|nr:hypothetical protein [Candidatus Brocadiia bacterium]
MRLSTLIRIASDSYPDGAVLDAHERGEAAGDTLALFIAREIAETFEPGQTTAEQLVRAIQVLEKAQAEIGAVLSGLRRRLEKEERS